MSGSPRRYRAWVKPEGLVAFEVREFETDLQVLAERDLSMEALAAARAARAPLIDYITHTDPDFLDAEVPCRILDGAPEIVKTMGRAARAAGVGPMAAVAGAIAEHVGRKLLELSREVIVENGGDIFIACTRERTIGIHAGRSRLSGRIGIIIAPEKTPLGVCTSSGTVGHSKSYGCADAACAIAPDAAVADAAATGLGNRIRGPEDLQAAVEWALTVKGVTGALAVFMDSLAAAGDVRLLKL